MKRKVNGAMHLYTVVPRISQGRRALAGDKAGPWLAVPVAVASYACGFSRTWGVRGSVHESKGW